jgi:TonB family protein
MEINGVFPLAAITAGKSGKVLLACDVSELGLLEHCTVTWESPPSLGFGTAALQLAPVMLMKPALVDGHAVRSSIHIPLNFPKVDRIFARDAVTVLDRPLWSAAPSRAAMLAAWPHGAEHRTEIGSAVLQCDIDRKGLLNTCKVTQEAPPSAGFGAAALSLAPQFHLAMSPQDAKTISSYQVVVPFHFVWSGSAVAPLPAPSHPVWIETLDPAAVAAVFPIAAKQAGLKAGTGKVSCAVGLGGALQDCSIVGEDPPGLGFGDAALSIASRMKMNPWSQDGGPVDGIRIKLPIQLVLPDENQPEAPAQSSPAVEPATGRNPR